MELRREAAVEVVGFLVEGRKDTQVSRNFGCRILLLGGGFKYVLFSALLGEDSHFD